MAFPIVQGIHADPTLPMVAPIEVATAVDNSRPPLAERLNDGTGDCEVITRLPVDAIALAAHRQVAVVDPGDARVRGKGPWRPQCRTAFRRVARNYACNVIHMLNNLRLVVVILYPMVKRVAAVRDEPKIVQMRGLSIVAEGAAFDWIRPG